MSQLRVSKRGVIYLVVVVITIIAGYQLIKLYSHNPEKEEGYSMEKVISNDGTEISFLRRGNGPPLILVHGTTADHTRWLPIIPYFEKQFTVYAMDRRGRGESGDSPNYHIMREAEDIAAVVKAIDDPVYLLGHSYGGLVALEAALLTDNIKKLILYEPPVPAGKPFYPPGVPDKMQPLIDNGEFESALEIFLKEVVKMPDYEFEKYKQLPAYKKRIQIVPTIPRETMVEKFYTFRPDKFAGLQVPVLLLLGGDSPSVFREATELVDSALSDSRIVIMQGQKHIAMDTNTELFVEEVKKFLAE
jgi:pimeloyl-ACP methyl ester carboxylesterase